jgi:hypothetical protein
MPKKRTPTNALPMRLEVVDWLLNGHTLACDDADPLRATGVYDPFIEFEPESTWPDLRALWQQHRAWLLAEWERRGGTGQPWAQRRFKGVCV